MRVLLIGNYRPSLHLARTLASEGHEVCCGVDDLNPYLFKSRAVGEAFFHASLEHEPDAALDHIERYLQARPGVDLLIPVSDPAARAFSGARDRFERRLRAALPPRAVMELCTDKAASFALCDSLGVPLAPRRVVSDHAALLEAVADIGRPCVVKPVDAANLLFGEKAIVLGAGDVVADRVPYWPAEHGRLCVQKFVGGHRHEVSFAASGGRLLGAVDGLVGRTDRIDGTGYTTELVSVRPLPAVARAVATLVEALDYTGVGNVEFLVDERRGEVTFLELDPRLSSSTKLAELCGLPLTRWMVDLATGGTPAPRADPWAYPAGRRLVWTKGDLGGLARSWRAGALGSAAAAGRLTAIVLAALRGAHATFDLHDPWPSAWIYLHGPLHRLTGSALPVSPAPARTRLERFTRALVRSDLVDFDGRPASTS